METKRKLQVFCPTPTVILPLADISKLVWKCFLKFWLSLFVKFSLVYPTEDGIVTYIETSLWAPRQDGSFHEMSLIQHLVHRVKVEQLNVETGEAPHFSHSISDTANFKHKLSELMLGSVVPEALQLCLMVQQASWLRRASRMLVRASHFVVSPRSGTLSQQTSHTAQTAGRSLGEELCLFKNPEKHSNT